MFSHTHTHTQQLLNSSVEIPAELSSPRGRDVTALQEQNGQLRRLVMKMAGDTALCSPPGKKMFSDTQQVLDRVSSKRKLRLADEPAEALRVATQPSVDQQATGWTWQLDKRLKRTEMNGKRSIDVNFGVTRQRISFNLLYDNGDDGDEAGMDGAA